MKKIILFIFLIFFTLQIDVNVTKADSENYYAKIQTSGVYLCSSPSENNTLFEIPYSYFIKVEYVLDGYFKVSYKDIEGYVRKDKVLLMKGTPKSPYAQATFKLFVPYGMYSSTSKNSNLIVQIDENVENIVYYGTKIGEQLTSNNNKWYYSSATINGTTYYGYIFSGVTDLLTTIEVNNEIYEQIDETAIGETSTQLSSLSLGTKIMLIVAISVPSLLILYFLIKPSKIIQVTNKRKQIKKESKKIQHGDYFEFDESEL